MLEKVLFIKRFPVGEFRRLPDMGSNVEVYVWDSPYLELETLGELVLLQPGESVNFEETWEVIAGDYPVTYETARTHLKSVFQKTGTCRQAELVVVIVTTLPGCVRLGSSKSLA